MSCAGEPIDASALGQPLDFVFSSRHALNRFHKGTMSEHLSSWSDDGLYARGLPSDELIEAYRIWGQGDIGLILTGNVMIDPQQLETEGNLIIPTDAPFSGPRFERSKSLGGGTKAHGSLVVAQVSHPGRQTPFHPQPHPISASTVQLAGEILGNKYDGPRAAADEDIRTVIEGFAHAAEYLEKAGYDGIQLHAAHGYLLSQFLSETTNRRTDQYGGSLENRMRLILEIREEISRRVRPDFVIAARVNSVEFQPSGFQSEEAKALCRSLKEHRFDFMTSDARRESTKKREAFLLDFAQMIVSSSTKTKSYLTGGFRSVEGMLKGLETLHGVGLARPLCQEPFLFGLAAVAACIQIRQMGVGLKPVDLGEKEWAEKVTAAVSQWGVLKQADRSESALWPPLLMGYEVPLAAQA
ncbi:NADH oxidase [Aspergillus ellipticus CBS 707.79]|uniref:NADH oxidase n=1 Tax=Aspergillus ellipticus CBS 707.79 TaxID=1448320 RepID=A0A319D694_9EURO|nr:NADH oxidase [Aspergillus ellipticus CBS 707.79]